MFTYLYTYLKARFEQAKDEGGQTLVEYGLIIALLSIVVIGVLGLLGDELIEVFNQVVGELSGAGSSPAPAPAPSTP